MHNWKRWMSLALLLLLVAACSQDIEPTPVIPTDTPAEATAVPTDEPATAVPTAEPAPTETTVEETAVPVEEPTEEPAEVGFTWPDPVAPYDTLSRAPVTAVEQTTFTELETNYPPARDDLALAIAYRGLTEMPSTEPPEPKTFTVGMREAFKVLNTDSNTISAPNFELMYISDHAYFWFDSTPGISEPTESELAATGAAFDQIYEQDTAAFGSEDTPGIDGDPRIHIVNASPLTVCDVTESTSHLCGLGGYFGSSDILPSSVDPSSNEREMFVMNGSFFGSNTYLDILAHEFRHMIESNYDANDWDWEVEGSAMLAEDLLGFPSDPIARGNMFLANPDQQLNRWVDGNTLPYYGQGYVINRYIYNRLGPDLYRAFATNPEHGFQAIDMIAAENGLDFDGMTIFLDWLAALAIHSDENAPEIYQLRDGLDTAANTGINKFPTAVDTTVSQYAADYYRLFGDGPVTLNFTGSNHTQLIKVLPVSGEHMWLANRANYSSMRLTHEFDLSGVDSATLEYNVFHEIEQGYDFAYLTISTDGGQTWQPLVGEQMQGEGPNDDPADAALTDRFYTGRSGDWVKETVDLSAYAGQMVQIRFEYVTDPILTFGGLALDNLAIPEIGFYDDAESDTGWVAEGFVRATGYVPQRWNVMLITYENGAPVVTQIELAEDNTATAEFSLSNAGGGRPMLIVAASSPMTLEPAHYQFELSQ
ncbi:MAG: immune inhibitor A [Ardenticatenaceae bacterium]|nr:immune inhibitor A [Ardenticatenaceae bacterium]